MLMHLLCSCSTSDIFWVSNTPCGGWEEGSERFASCSFIHRCFEEEASYKLFRANKQKIYFGWCCGVVSVNRESQMVSFFSPIDLTWELYSGMLVSLLFTLLSLHQEGFCGAVQPRPRLGNYSMIFFSSLKCVCGTAPNMLRQERFCNRRCW